MTAYYNEIDPFAAQWLRELIKQGHIAPGIVDERSIEDVTPNDLSGFTQCHFFAGIGVWSYALRQAGWPDDRPVWTGSCPCQPFSSAGKGGGFADERHLWPAFHWLIDQCRPQCVLGEQVAGKDGLAWLDLVSNDLEKSDYACGAAVTAACGFGAPHQRKRLYWVGIGPLGNAPGIGHLQRVMGNQAGQECPPLGRGQEPGQGSGRHDPAHAGEPYSVADTSGQGLEGQRNNTAEQAEWQRSQVGIFVADGAACRPGPTNGHWRDADWLGCRDGKWRSVEPGSFPLVTRATSRVGRLRGYGNAIVAQQAQAFIEAVRES